MTEQQEQELYSFIRKAHGVILMGDDLAAIRSILTTPSEPEQADAEGMAEELASWKKTAEQAQDLWRKYEAMLQEANRQIDFLNQRVDYINNVLKIDNA